MNSSSTRFVANSFQYNGRVALALLPSLAVLALLGGQQVLAILSIGCMLAYIMDALTYREGALAAAWATLGVTGVALGVKVVVTGLGGSAAVLICLLFTSVVLLCTTGMWATLQFKWIQVQFPAVALACERLLLVLSLPTASVMHTVGAALVVELSVVPFVTAASLVIMYHLLGRPLVSSFCNPQGHTSLGGALPPLLLAIGKADGFVLALLTALLPATLYTAMHSSVLLHWLHLWSVLLLVGGPLSYLLAVPDGCWWLPGPPHVQAAVRRLLLLLSLAALVAGDYAHSSTVLALRILLP